MHLYFMQVLGVATYKMAWNTLRPMTILYTPTIWKLYSNVYHPQPIKNTNNWDIAKYLNMLKLVIYWTVLSECVCTFFSLGNLQFFYWAINWWFLVYQKTKQKLYLFNRAIFHLHHKQNVRLIYNILYDATLSINMKKP